MNPVCLIQDQTIWFTEIGLALDIAGFGLLALDVIGAIRSEREALAETAAVRRRAFDARYGFFAPDEDTRQIQEYEFNAEEALRTQKWVAATSWRKRRVLLGIAMVLSGYVCQLIGSWPCS